MSGWLEGAVGADRQGQRVTYGSYLQLMTSVLRQTHAPGEYIFRQGTVGEAPFPPLDGRAGGSCQFQ